MAEAVREKKCRKTNTGTNVCMLVFWHFSHFQQDKTRKKAASLHAEQPNYEGERINGYRGIIR